MEGLRGHVGNVAGSEAGPVAGATNQAVITTVTGVERAFEMRAVKRWWSLLVVGALLLAPLLVTGVWLRENEHFAPLFDLAMTEQRVRDVGTAHTPLLGLPGRLGAAQSGSHPGPLSFYLLAPLYRLLGGTYLALRISTLALNGVAVVTSLLIAWRRAGTPGVFVTGIALALLELGFGPRVLSEPWNPHLPVLWFTAFLLAVWSVVAGDFKLLPVAAATGTLAAQTHIPYLAICGGLGALTVAVAGAAWWRSRSGDGHSVPLLRPFGAAGLVVLLLWSPVLIEQALGEPGNVRVLFEYFSSSTLPALGVPGAIGVVVERLDVWHLVVHSFEDPGILADGMRSTFASPMRGAVLLVAWLASVLVVRRLHDPALGALHVVAAALLLAEVLAFRRIVGFPWNYLVYSAWTASGLVLSATLATFGAWSWWRLAAPLKGARALGTGAGLAALVTIVGRLGLDVKRAGSDDPNASTQLFALGTAVAERLRAREAETGLRGPYLVTWSDALYQGGQGLGLVNELERAGFVAGPSREFALFVTPNRLVDPSNAVARIHLANGPWIEKWRSKPNAVLVAVSDPRTREELEEYQELRKAVLESLRGMGRDDAGARFDANHAAADVPGLDVHAGLAVRRLHYIGLPAAVFMVPVANAKP